MKKKSYLDFANIAIQMEKEEKYNIAAEYWGKANKLATTLNTQLWSEYRQEHNEKRHSLHHSHSTALRSTEIATRKENRRIASELKKHMNKQVVNNDSI
ncbi:ANR family transcriptional regulator [Xenorhabdus bharatensis]|uniref:ANR family transcriptional regulator n=1 Tax=Xenorhabdus bharatensis TaxID=3136256 RepID=UPI0030F47748